MNVEKTRRLFTLLLLKSSISDAKRNLKSYFASPVLVSLEIWTRRIEINHARQYRKYKIACATCRLLSRISHAFGRVRDDEIRLANWPTDHQSRLEESLAGRVDRTVARKTNCSHSVLDLSDAPPFVRGSRKSRKGEKKRTALRAPRSNDSPDLQYITGARRGSERKKISFFFFVKRAPLLFFPHRN